MGVGVGAEGQAEALQHAHHFAGRHPGRAAEGHVLEEMGQAALVVALVERAGADAQAQRTAAGRGGVVLDRVPHAVGKAAEADVGIGGPVTVVLRPHALAFHRLAGIGAREGGGESEEGRQGDGGVSWLGHGQGSLWRRVSGEIRHVGAKARKHFFF